MMQSFTRTARVDRGGMKFGRRRSVNEQSIGATAEWPRWRLATYVASPAVIMASRHTDHSLVACAEVDRFF